MSPGLLLLAFALSQGLSTAGAAPAREALYERIVTSVSFRGDAPEDPKDLARLVDIEAGKPLTQTAIQTSLRNLHATRRFSDLSVEAAPAGNGVAVVFVFAAAPRVHRLRIVGKGVPERGRLLDSVPSGVGGYWDAAMGPAGERDLTRLLRERGFFEAAVKVVVDAGPDETSVDVRFEAEPGRRARAGAPDWEGATPPLPPARLAKVPRLKVGKVYRESRAKDDVERYEKVLREAGYARAEVRFLGVRYDAEKLTAHPRYSLIVGPIVTLVVIGDKRKAVLKHTISPWARGTVADEEAVRQLADGLRATYQGSGYARATVNVAFENTPEEERITFTIDKGSRYAVSDVAVEGVEALSLRDVRGAIKTEPRGVVAVGRLQDAELGLDRDALQGLYRARGFSHASVKTRVGDGPSPFTLGVTFRVEEGRPSVVASRELSGMRAISEEALLPLLVVKEGGRFTAAEVEADAAALRAYYADHGYPNARVDASAKVEAVAPGQTAPERVNVAYAIIEGEPVTFGRTIIRGNRRTRASVISREVVQKPGEPYSFSKVVETQQNLGRLTLFSRTELTHLVDPTTGSRATLITVEEAKPWTITYGIGAEYTPDPVDEFGLRGSLGITYSNLFGRGLVVSAEGRYSTTNDRLLGTIREPNVLWNIGVSLTAFKSRDTISNFEVRRRGMFIEGTKRFSKLLGSALRYQYEIVENPDPSAPADSTERQNSSIKIASLGPAIVYDSRDDPIFPKRGLFAAGDGKWAFPLLAADANFVKGFVQTSTYLRMGRTIVATTVRVGAIEPLAACEMELNPTCAENLKVPIAERLFAGGRSTHRAFGLDLLGIYGETLQFNEKEGGGFELQPIGGNGLLTASLEWRVPVVSDFGVVAFVDVGNVWADYRNIRLNDLRPGAGLGVYFQTPFGPIRLEYGWKLDRKTVALPDGTPFQESPGEFQFSVGYPF